MISKDIQVLLADDDKDDSFLFKEALEELQPQITLTTVHDGEELLQLLAKKSAGFFHLLFLDLNMPRKNGFKCLEEIKADENLKRLPVIIFSTSYDNKSADILYKNGAQYFVCKPLEFSHLKEVIYRVIELTFSKNTIQPPRENFLLSNSKVILV